MPLRPAAVILAGVLAFAGLAGAPLRGEPPVTAGESASAVLAGTLRIGEVIGVLRDEGLAYGASLEDQLFPGRGGPGWRRSVERIYDPAAMRRRFEAAFAGEIGADGAALAAAGGFFGDSRGQRILTLEIEARRALLDEAVEEAARARAEEMLAADDPRMTRLHRFAEANDLVEANVQGALNANLAFFRGMAEGGAFDAGMTEAEMLSEVWAQEPAVRAETEEWLYPYLTLAYGPLDDADLDAYIAFSETPQGQRLNAALFAAFDAVFTAISRDLGRAAAGQMAGRDI